MNAKKIILGTALSAFMVATAQTKELARINISLTATVIDYSCAISFGDEDKTVSLGSWDPAYFHRAGKESVPVPFILHLTECPLGSVAITFQGQSSAADPDLLALEKSDDSAQNIAIKILDADKKLLPLGHASPQVAVDAEGNASMKYYANYIALGNGVVGGSANADASFTINYY